MVASINRSNSDDYSTSFCGLPQKVELQDAITTKLHRTLAALASKLRKIRIKLIFRRRKWHRL